MAAWEVKMILTTGNNRNRSNRGQIEGFTLIELILVMALLLIVLAVSSPQLQRFFKGRNLDSESRRLLSLTTYGQSRAVSEGVPMLLWLNTRSGTYGLRAASGYLDPDPKTLEYDLDPNLHMEVMLPPAVSMTPNLVDRVTGNLPTIRFTPDGFITESSPERIYIIQNSNGSDDSTVLELSTNRLRYELQPVNPAARRR